MTSRLTLDGVTVMHGRREIVRDVSLTLGAGELVVLVGTNGAGKTTLLRAALGLLRPQRGRIELDGRDAASLSPLERAARLAWLPQTPFVSEPLAVIEHVAAARYRFAESAARARGGAARALARVGAAPLAERALATLSGGERQRVALAAMLAQEAPLLLLDEPANHLDPRQQRETQRLVSALAGDGHGVLCVTHDVGVLAGLVDDGRTRVIGLAAGRLAFELPVGSPELAPRLGELFGLSLELLTRPEARALVAWWPRADSEAPPWA